MHYEDELEYAELEPDLYGINNRNLGTFETNVENSFRLADQLTCQCCQGQRERHQRILIPSVNSAKLASRVSSSARPS